jgi:hypothetical protein
MQWVVAIPAMHAQSWIQRSTGTQARRLLHFGVGRDLREHHICNTMRQVSSSEAPLARKRKALTPAAFLSYVRFDDKHEDGKISEIRERLSSEVRAQTGDEFPIFQDRNDIQWGENWESRIEDALDSSTFLIPVITPSFFKSPSCRKELERFFEKRRSVKTQ